MYVLPPIIGARDQRARREKPAVQVHPLGADVWQAPGKIRSSTLELDDFGSHLDMRRLMSDHKKKSNGFKSGE